jgi:hypothetical protein
MTYTSFDFRKKTDYQKNRRIIRNKGRVDYSCKALRKAIRVFQKSKKISSNLQRQESGIDMFMNELGD